MAQYGEDQVSANRTTSPSPLQLTQEIVLLNDAQQSATHENSNETMVCTDSTKSWPMTQSEHFGESQVSAQRQASTAEMETQSTSWPTQTHGSRGTYGSRRRQNRADLQAEQDNDRMEGQTASSSSYSPDADPNWLPPYQRQYQRDDGDGTWSYDRQGTWWKCAWSEESGWSNWAPSVEEDAPRPKRPCQANNN